MNRLDPDLKRLIGLARQAPESPCPEAPTGFAGRVVARWEPDQSNNFPAVWQRAISLSAWASVVLILCGAVFLMNQRRPGSTAYDFTAAYQVIADNIVP